MTEQLLTPGQVRVIAGLARGLRPAQIAPSVLVTPQSVRSHITRAALRVGLTGMLQPALVHYAYLTGYFAGLRPEPRPPISVAGRQADVLRGIALGLTTEEIAGRFGISPHTVHEHRRRLLKNLDARTRAHAVALGWQAELLGPLPSPVRLAAAA